MWNRASSPLSFPPRPQLSREPLPLNVHGRPGPGVSVTGQAGSLPQVIIVIYLSVVGALLLYMAFLMLVDPLIRKPDAYTEQLRNEEENEVSRFLGARALPELCPKLRPHVGAQAGSVSPFPHAPVCFSPVRWPTCPPDPRASLSRELPSALAGEAGAGSALCLLPGIRPPPCMHRGPRCSHLCLPGLRGAHRPGPVTCKHAWCPGGLDTGVELAMGLQRAGWDSRPLLSARLVQSTTRAP